MTPEERIAWAVFTANEIENSEMTNDSRTTLSVALGVAVVAIDWLHGAASDTDMRDAATAFEAVRDYPPSSGDMRAVPLIAAMLGRKPKRPDPGRN